MSVTGNGSSKVVQVYKQMSIQQEEQLCDLISPMKMKTEEPGHAMEKEDECRSASISITVL